VPPPGYGSDALAGVVNFVLDTKFTGLKSEISGGMSNYGMTATTASTSPPVRDSQAAAVILKSAARRITTTGC